MIIEKYPPEQVSEFRANLLSFLTQTHSFTGSYPEEEVLLKKFLVPREELRQFIEQESFQNALHARGLPPLFFSPPKNPLLNLDENDYDPLFIAVANVMTNPADTRSDNAKLKQFEPMGVNKEIWTGWLSESKNALYVASLTNKRFDVHAELAAKNGLMKRLKEGDLNAVKYYNEITGKYRPVDPNGQTMAIMMAMLMEILSRHLPPSKVDAIAEELEMIQLPQLDAVKDDPEKAIIEAASTESRNIFV